VDFFQVLLRGNLLTPCVGFNIINVESEKNKLKCRNTGGTSNG